MSEQRKLGYVVVEFNQASGQPGIDGYFSDDREDIVDAIEQRRQTDFATGRKERYAVGTITIEEGEQ